MREKIAKKNDACQIKKEQPNESQDFFEYLPLRPVGFCGFVQKTLDDKDAAQNCQKDED